MPKYNLARISTRAPEDLDKKEIQDQTDKLIRRIAELQDVLYAQNKHSLLVVIQGQDASGKDGAIKNVFSRINPQGVSVTSFKKPTPLEMSHDFLWRVHAEVPGKGQIKIFNRSHYEDVLITRVEGWIDDQTARRRFEHINAFEQLLQNNGTCICKFFLHVSPEEQEKRFYERLTDPQKMWKYGEEDLLKLRKKEQYAACYEEAFEACSPEIAWTIVPADQNWYKEYLIAKTVCDALTKMDLEYPKPKINMNTAEVQEILKKFNK